MRLYRESHLGKRLPAYDGRKSLYTAGPLPFVSKEFRIVLIDEDDGTGGQRFIDYQLSIQIRFYTCMYLIFCLYLITGGRGSSKL